MSLKTRNYVAQAQDIDVVLQRRTPGDQYSLLLTRSKTMVDHLGFEPSIQGFNLEGSHYANDPQKK